MKAKIFYLGFIAAMVISYGCNNQSTIKGTEIVHDASKDTTAMVTAPAKQYLSKAQLQEQVDKEIQEALRLANDELVAEAEEVISKTNEAIVLLLNGDYEAAVDVIERAIGKAEVVMAIKPELSFVPVDVEVAVHDLVTDLDYVKRIEDEVESLTDKGYLQAARQLLSDLSSEVNIRTYSMPLASFPVALKTAVKLANEKKYDEAVIVLNSALNTIVVRERAVPIPLIRAERMLLEVDSLLAQENKNEDINTLLENADYQIRFAEALGYGKKDKEFEELYDAIKEIRKELEKAEGGTSKKLVPRLREKLKTFKERISPGRTSES